jgi:amidohydrolase
MDMKNIQSLKTHILQAANTLEKDLKQLSLQIHASPETGMDEVNASTWIAEYLAHHGFVVKKAVGNLPTAFTASYGQGQPHIAILAEYDALPGLGHACGHNIIGTSAAGAAVLSKPVIDSHGGTITVIGSPSEELHCGKELLIREGVFSDIDLAMMVHPCSQNAVTISTLACINLGIVFTGQSAHASHNPEEGINALEAMILGFNAINSLRQHIPKSARIHGIITDGGQAANIVPAHSAAMFMVRASSMSHLKHLQKRVEACFQGAALATGSKLDCHWADTCYEPMKNNLVMADLFRHNMESIGRTVETKTVDFASTDMGNVSNIVPSIHPLVAIAPPETSLHTTGFLNAAASEEGMKGMMDSAIAMALTVADVLGSPEIISEIKKDFHNNKKSD